jgi:hypothetical protein
MIIAGITLKVMSANFHWTARATMKAAQNVDRFWMKEASLSAMPWLILEPFVVTRTATDDEF